MTATVYVTIWVAMIAFVCGEVLRTTGDQTDGSRATTIAWWTFSSGLVMAMVHTLLAFAVVHGWSHDAAVHRTREQTVSVYGFPLGEGIYVNYLFFGAWFAHAWWWRRHPGRRMRPSLEWPLRAFYLIVLFNATVVFAGGWRRWLGVALVLALAGAWGVQRRQPGLRRVTR